MGSARTPGKSMEIIGGVPVVEVVLRRLVKARNLSKVVLATSDLDRDTVLAEHAAKIGIPVFRGSENDLVARFMATADAYADGPYIVRATGDNVFMDWDEIDRVIDFGIGGGWDFVGFDNVEHPQRINDFAGEFIRLDALRQVAASTWDAHDREHVFPYFYAHPETFRVSRIDVAKELHTAVKLDLDTPDDLALMKRIGEAVADPVEVPAREVVRIAEQFFS